MKRLLVLAFLVIIIGGAIVLGSAMGLYQLPWFSDWLYRIPTPTKNITITNTTEVFNESIIKPVATSSDQYRITLSDEQLTVIARQSLAGNDGYFEPGVQLVAVPGNLELFGLLRKPVTGTVLIRIAPAVENGTLTGVITYAQMGAVPIAPSSMNMILVPAISAVQDALEQYVKGYTVDAVTVENGAVTLDLKRSSQ